MNRHGNGVVYARVNTPKQEGDNAIENQVKKCLGIAAEVKCPVEKENILMEQGSGVDTLRPVFQELQKRVASGEFTHVFIYAPDRASRDLLDLLNFCRICKNAGAQIHFVVGPVGCLNSV